MKSQRIHYISLGLLAASLLFASGCSSYISIRTMRPGAVNLGATKKMDLLHTQGRRSAREVVTGRLIAQSRAGGHFQVRDLSEKGIEVKIAGRLVTLSDGTMVPTGTVGARVDVIEWQAGRDVLEETYKDRKGVERVRSIRVVKGTALLGVTLFTASGKAILAEKEYEGKAQMRGSKAGKDAALRLAADDAVRKLLHDITPTPVVMKVQLDDSDKGQKDIIKAAEGGNLARATTDLRVYLKSHANNPAGLYNLAVFTDAAGDYAAAIALYDRAIKMSQKEWYSTARAQCAKREAARAALQQ